MAPDVRPAIVAPAPDALPMEGYPPEVLRRGECAAGVGGWFSTVLSGSWSEWGFDQPVWDWM